MCGPGSVVSLCIAGDGPHTVCSHACLHMGPLECCKLRLCIATAYTLGHLGTRIHRGEDTTPTSTPVAPLLDLTEPHPQANSAAAELLRT
jgi:hypothetical protein